MAVLLGAIALPTSLATVAPPPTQASHDLCSWTRIASPWISTGKVWAAAEVGCRVPVIRLSVQVRIEYKIDQYGTIYTLVRDDDGCWESSEGCTRFYNSASKTCPRSKGTYYRTRTQFAYESFTGHHQESGVVYTGWKWIPCL